jgi:hypothetical protein
MWMKNWKEAITVYFMVLLQFSSEITEENHEKRQDRRPLGREKNLAPPPPHPVYQTELPARDLCENIIS